VIDVPALRAFEAMGLYHTVVLNSDMPQIRVANLRTLARVRAVAPEPESFVLDQITDLLQRRAFLPLGELMKELKLTSASPILKLILMGKLFADLDRQLLTSPESCLLSDDKRLLREVIDCELASSFSSPQSEVGIELAPTRKVAEIALQKLELVRSGVSTRSVRRWRTQIKKNAGLSPFLAMLPVHHRKGNRLSKRPIQVLNFVEQSIREHWANKQRPSISNAYSAYRIDALKSHKGIAPVSQPTFAKMVHLQKQALAEARGGHRLANALSSPCDVNKRAIRATRPFEYAQVDHCLAKIYCELYRTEKHTYVVRPWLTVLRDAHTGEPLARWISFNRPSRVAVAMVIRSCLRRHGRLPETISVDKGGEFLSVYLSSLAAHYGFHLEIRPSANSRFGGPIEQLFGLFRSLWLDRCVGNCTDIRQVRGLSSSHHPRNLKCMGLPDFLREFDAFCAWFIHERLKGTTTPFAVRKEGLERFPFSGIAIPYDDAFVISTAVDQGMLTIDGPRGIKVGDEHYWHPELRRYAASGSVEVRLEPEDHTCIYARVGDQWLTARSARHPALACESEHRRLAESLLVMDAKDQRAKAKQDSKDALVRVWRCADNDFSASQEGASPAETVCETDAEDLWDKIRSHAVHGLPVSVWRAAK
jgi:putative transposase